MVSELKASLSAYLTRVKAGEEVIVTERGKPVAKLVPLPPTLDDDEEWKRLERMAAEGRVKLPAQRTLPADFWTLPMPEDPEGLVLKALLEDREEGW